MTSEECAEQLCLKCGLCCNGVLFKDVRLQPTDNPGLLTRSGLKLTPIPSRKNRKGTPKDKRTVGSRFRLPQPCPAFETESCRCAVYSHRPGRCAQFECLLFIAVRNGETTLPSALRVIADARRKASKVLLLLDELQGVRRNQPLSLRFQAVRRQMEGRPSTDPERVDRYADLTLAVHELNLLLGGAFYP